MKLRNIKNGSLNNDWETPEYVYKYMEMTFFKTYPEYFDPCPLHSQFDSLIIPWHNANYINPPYSKALKEAFVIKALKESKLNKLCVMLLPVSTDTKLFYYIIAPNAKVIFIKGRIQFKGYSTTGKFVTNRTGQSGSMFVIFGKDYLPNIETTVVAN